MHGGCHNAAASKMAGLNYLVAHRGAKAGSGLEQFRDKHVISSEPVADGPIENGSQQQHSASGIRLRRNLSGHETARRFGKLA
jgi:hypothetical protein